MSKIVVGTLSQAPSPSNSSDPFFSIRKITMTQDKCGRLGVAELPKALLNGG